MQWNQVKFFEKSWLRKPISRWFSAMKNGCFSKPLNGSKPPWPMRMLAENIDYMDSCRAAYFITTLRFYFSNLFILSKVWANYIFFMKMKPSVYITLHCSKSMWHKMRFFRQMIISTFLTSRLIRVGFLKKKNRDAQNWCYLNNMQSIFSNWHFSK